VVRISGYSLILFLISVDSFQSKDFNLPFPSLNSFSCKIFVSVLPFIALQITGMLLVMFYPEIALWFPKWLGS